LKTKVSQRGSKSKKIKVISATKTLKTSKNIIKTHILKLRQKKPEGVVVVQAKKVNKLTIKYLALSLNQSRLTIATNKVLKAKGAKSCHAYCKSKGYYCNDWTVGTNQQASCAQACMLRWGGYSKDKCIKTVAAHKITPSCWLTIPINGKNFRTTMCSSCKDKPKEPKSKLKELEDILSSKNKFKEYAGEEGCYFRETGSFKPSKTYIKKLTLKMYKKSVSLKNLRNFCYGKL